MYFAFFSELLLVRDKFLIGKLFIASLQEIYFNVSESIFEYFVCNFEIVEKICL